MSVYIPLDVIIYPCNNLDAGLANICVKEGPRLCSAIQALVWPFVWLQA